jgi:hypothetical protein
VNDDGAYHHVAYGQTPANTHYAGHHSHTITIDSAGEASPVTDGASSFPPYYKVAFTIKL